MKKTRQKQTDGVLPSNLECANAFKIALGKEWENDPDLSSFLMVCWGTLTHLRVFTEIDIYNMTRAKDISRGKVSSLFAKWIQLLLRMERVELMPDYLGLGYVSYKVIGL